MARHARIGLIFFGAYFLLYVRFVLLAAYNPAVMERTPWAGVNLAIWYGFGLIAAAILLAMLYGVVCSLRPDDTPTEPSPSEERP